VWTGHACGLLGQMSPRTIAAGGLGLATVGAVLLSTAGSDPHFASNLLPGMVVLGFGVGLVAVAVAVTAMAGIPGPARGHGVGIPDDRPRGRCGPRCRHPLRDRDRRRQSHRRGRSRARFSPALVSAAVLTVFVGVVAWLRMPAAPMTGAAAMHMH
jgi:hypothetical protein